MADETYTDHSDGVIECEACNEFLPLCRCTGRCQNCLAWRDRCRCKGRQRRRRGGARVEWLCFECEFPLEQCTCNERLWENLVRGAAGVRDPAKRRKMLMALIALKRRVGGERGSSGIDFSRPGRNSSRAQPSAGRLPGGRRPGAPMGK